MRGTVKVAGLLKEFVVNLVVDLWDHVLGPAGEAVGTGDGGGSYGEPLEESIRWTCGGFLKGMGEGVKGDGSAGGLCGRSVREVCAGGL